MEDAQSKLFSLRSLNAAILEQDPELREETYDLGSGAEVNELARPGADHGAGDEMVQESIILRRNRPVLKIKDDIAELEFSDPSDGQIWGGRLSAAKDLLRDVNRAVGRINLVNAPFAWVGTGWLVRDDIIVTNRHVAQEFVLRGDGVFEFEQFEADPLRPEIDFVQEFQSVKVRSFRLVEVLDVVPRPGPDIAFIRVEHTSGDHTLASPIALADAPEVTSNAAVIGYPAYDSRIPEIDLMEQIYGGEYDKKRLAPGAVTAIQDTRLSHNCTTLGGNSGSAVIDLDRGQAIGLHFSGAFLRSNYAVPSNLVAEALARVERGRPAAFEQAKTPAPTQVPAATPAARASQSASVTLPLTLTLSIAGTSTVPQILSINTQTLPEEDEDWIEDETESAASYAGRPGYDPEFLGTGDMACPLPQVTADTDAVLEFDDQGTSGTELRYQHFSVVMNRTRRMCFFSAVNIDGAQAKPAARVKWKWDPRISKAHQIMRECYGNPPKFSRGHMTRRNDPGWGSDGLARLGNRDSMHVTNATPQMQTFNAPVWLELEDYALNNAIEDGMRISVFTGPFFKPDDPIRFGIRIPVHFWKVIAFNHDQTGALTATGYRMDQTGDLPPAEEFVFGDFTSSHTGEAAQVSIRSIEEEAGISFGGLASLDPLGQQEAVSGRAETVALGGLGDVRFV